MFNILPIEFWIWYLMLFILGIVMLPLTKQIFGKFFYDYGYPFSKTISIIIVSFLVFLAGLTKILPFSFITILSVISLMGVVNGYLLKKQIEENEKIKKPYFDNKQFFIILVEEITFFVALAFLAIVRAQEPSINGLEKFMDFGFMNSILRTEYFPSLDMWLSADQAKPNGYPINYYYFGHLIGSLLIKLSQVSPFIGYNLVLATIFAQAVTSAFSLSMNLVYAYQYLFTEIKQTVKIHILIIYGFLGSFIVNLAGNLHTIYLFTTGYEAEDPRPFWEIMKPAGEIFRALLQQQESISNYWYPNATRFIPYTIHEFPSYSYVVADLHGHVFGIPIVLTILSIFVLIYLYYSYHKPKSNKSIKKPNINKLLDDGASFEEIKKYLKQRIKYEQVHHSKFSLALTAFLGFLIGIAYTTNALDGPIYMLFALLIFILLFRISLNFIIHFGITIAAFLLTITPFSLFFSPFASKIGVNCSPKFLTDIGSFSKFIFEEGNCQVSPFWMLFILWGFFWICLILLITTLVLKNRKKIFMEKKETIKSKITRLFNQKNTNNLLEGNIFDIFALFLFGYGTFLIIIPEFFYIKDIYPDHFRANTMFKLGYQAFIMMGFASLYAFFRLNQLKRLTNRLVLVSIFFIFFFFIFLYPFQAFPSYYPGLVKLSTGTELNLDGSTWIKEKIPHDWEIINYFQKNIKGQPVILEAQGDSYSEFNRVSAYTGLPTVAGWWVHQWLWRGSSEVVAQRVPDIVTIYESEDTKEVKELLDKYHVSYVIVSNMEREKYKNLKEEKFKQLGKKVFQSSNDTATIYRINQ